jgi:YaiO family outer membrane protein
VPLQKSAASWCVFFLIFCLPGLIFPAHPTDLSDPLSLQDQQIDVDEMFLRARSLGQDGNFPEALRLCRRILEQAPGYHDVRVYLGRLLLWERDYAAARPEFEKVLRQNPDHLDAFHGLIDTELWSKDPEAALEVCERGLRLHPQDPKLLWKKARIHYVMRDYQRTADTLRSLLALNPDHAEALRLYPLVQSSTRLLDLSQTYRLEVLGRGDEGRHTWHFFSLEAASHTDWGTVIGRFNYADRDYGGEGFSGKQIELESYPIFSERFYAHLQAGYSPDSIFPRTRLGGELYANLPRAFEISGGVRYLHFPNSDAVVVTGTLGKYYRNYWFSFRPSFSTESSGSAFSALFWARRYYRSGDEYVGVLAGFGTTPVDLYFLEDIQRYSSFRIGAEIKKPLSRGLIIRGHLRFEREEYRPDVFGSRFVLDVRLEERIYRKY